LDQAIQRDYSLRLTCHQIHYETPGAKIYYHISGPHHPGQLHRILSGTNLSQRKAIRSIMFTVHSYGPTWYGVPAGYGAPASNPVTLTMPYWFNRYAMAPWIETLPKLQHLFLSMMESTAIHTSSEATMCVMDIGSSRRVGGSSIVYYRILLGLDAD
jgi:hypothetical protein